MVTKPTYEELEQRVRESENEAFDLKQAEEALRESERNYHGIFDNSTDTIFIHDAETGAIVDVNRTCCDVFGYTLEEIRELDVADLSVNTPPYTQEEALQWIRKASEQGPQFFEWLAKDRDGRLIWFENSLLHANIGGKKRILVFGRNIDDRKQAEEVLRESEEKLRTIIEHSNELFYIHDTEHALTYASQTSVDLLGYTPEEMIIKWTELATDNPINQKGLEITEKGIATGEKQEPYLLELAKKDGTNVLLEIDESPVKDATGKVVAISGAARDVTEQKRIEQRLLKSEKGFRDLFDSITDLVFTQDFDGRFTSVNRAMCNVFGYERGEFIGKPASDFMKPEMRPFFEGGYLEQIKTKGSLEGITSYFAKNGDEIYIDYRSSLVKPDHGAPYITGTGRDVTEQVFSRKEIKRLQNQVHQSQKMEAIGLMAGGVAHDLNNILSGIVSYPELLLMDLPEGSPLRKPIKTIQESGMRAADVVADLLTVARGVATGREVANLNFQTKDT